jgi:hypothetical protein
MQTQTSIQTVGELRNALDGYSDDCTFFIMVNDPKLWRTVRLELGEVVPTYDQDTAIAKPCLNFNISLRGVELIETGVRA